MLTWVNFFQRGLDQKGTEGIIEANVLRKAIADHDGAEAYHCAFDLEQSSLKREEIRPDGSKVFHELSANSEKFPATVAKYAGNMRPAMGYAWFDFDSSDKGESALLDARKFVELLGAPPGLLFFFSGSKGFHVGVPFGYFGMPVSKTVAKQLHACAIELKKQLPSIDTTVFNPQRKFRAVGTLHPKTGLYKIRLLNLDLSVIECGIEAGSRGVLTIPSASQMVEPIELLTKLCEKAPPVSDSGSISVKEWRAYKQPEGSEIFKQCSFIKHCADSPAEISEPQWYAAASIVGRMQDGRAKFHVMSKGHPTYNKSVTDDKLEQALQASGPRKCSAIENLWDGCKLCPHYQRITSPININDVNVINTESTGFYDVIVNEKNIKYIPNYRDLLKAYVRSHPYKTISDMKCVYLFNGTHYKETNPIAIKGYAESHFDPEPKEAIRVEFTTKVFANNITTRAFFNEGTEGKINFHNGVFNVESGELIPHSPDFGFRHVLPYDYDPNATCPHFDAWLLDVMLGDAELVAILQEYMGYVVRGGEYIYHKALWLSGSGRNGKSTFLNVLKALIGHDNYSAISIRQIINDKFAAAALDGMIANFSEETSPEELSDSGPFKNLTGDGDVQAQKKYGDPYKFKSRAKLIMTYNEIPQLKDLSPGMLSRPIIIPWKKDLTDEGSQDKKLQPRLLKELPGIFNFALEGLRRLELNEKFTASEKSREELENVQAESCTAIKWFKENVVLKPVSDEYVLMPLQMYAMYKAAVGQYAYSEVKFLRRIGTLASVRERKARNTQEKTYYKGMVLVQQKDLNSIY